jgi:4-amino-4-deoxy-L-arabinose transferase-like glycosyltransferase
VKVLKNPAVLILIVALVFRMAFLFGMLLPGKAQDGYVLDSFAYVNTAEHIAAGNGLQITKHDVTSKQLLTEPGYCMFLGFWYVLGFTANKSILFIQAFLGALLAPLIYAYVLRRSSKYVALAAGLIYAVDPICIAPCLFILRELFVMLFIMTTLWAIDLTSKKGVVAKGFLIGFGALASPVMTLWSVVLWFWDRVISPNKRVITVSVVLIAWLVVGSWVVRNMTLSKGNYALRKHEAGILLYYTAQYDFKWLPNPYDPEFKKIVEDTKERFHKSGFVDEQRDLEKEYLMATWELFKAAPFTVAFRFVKSNFWFWVEVPGAMGMLKSKPALHYILLSWHALQLIFFFIGMYMLKVNKALADFRFVWGTVFYLALFIIPFMPIPRYYVPILPLINIIAAYGLINLLRRYIPSLKTAE